MSTNGSNGARAMESKDLDGSVVNDNSGHAPPLHCIRQVREQQNTSLRRAARQLGKNIHEASRQEEETSDLRLSELYAWQKLLGVPAADLLIDNDTPLSRPVLERARLVRMMKTAAAIREECQTKPIERLAERLIDQLVEIMPELKDVGAWHAVGQRRSLDEFGRVFERRLSEDLLFQYSSEPLD